MLNSRKSGVGQAFRAAALLPGITGGDVSQFHVLARPLAAMLHAAFQRDVFPEDMKSSLGDRSFQESLQAQSANYRPVMLGEALCRPYAAISNQRIVS